ncbi:MAG: hypothetical protein IPL78_32865 [Chloroflexi bacterium]|nr:hypothetical protein [Chloroflexota bacterium]
MNSVDGVPPSLRQQVEAGLHLYVLTAERLAPVLSAETRPLVQATVALIDAIWRINRLPRIRFLWR